VIDLRDRYFGRVPINLLAYVLKYKLDTSFRTFLFLKKESTTGTFRLTEELSLSVCKKASISKKSLSRHLEQLIRAGFINQDYSGLYFLRGYQRLQCKFRLSKGKLVSLEDSHLEKKNFKTFIFASTIGERCTKHYWYTKRHRGQKSGGPKHRCRNYTDKELSSPNSLRYVELRYGISKSKAHVLFNKAIKLQYLYRIKDEQKTNIASAEIPKSRLNGGDLPIYCYAKNGKIVIRNSNRYIACLEISGRRRNHSA